MLASKATLSTNLPWTRNIWKVWLIHVLLQEEFFRFEITRQFDNSVLTLSWRRPLSYRNQSIDLLCRSMDWFLYDNGPHHERVNSRDSYYATFLPNENGLSGVSTGKFGHTVFCETNIEGQLKVEGKRTKSSGSYLY